MSGSRLDTTSGSVGNSAPLVPALGLVFFFPSALVVSLPSSLFLCTAAILLSPSVRNASSTSAIPPLSAASISSAVMVSCCSFTVRRRFGGAVSSAMTSRVVSISPMTASFTNSSQVQSLSTACLDISPATQFLKASLNASIALFFPSVSNLPY